MKYPESLININGKLVAPEEAQISVFDRGFLFGDSVYEVTQGMEGVPVFLEEHLDRLWNSARIISLPLHFEREYLTAEIYKTFEAFKDPNAYLRVMITRGVGDLNIDPTTSENNSIIIIAKHAPQYPNWWYEKGVNVIISDVLRNNPKSIDPNAKSGNYLNNVLALHQAKAQGAVDAVMVNAQGMVTEGTTNNIWIVEGNKLITPPLKSGLLKGITREKILELGRENQIEVHEIEFDKERLVRADECFLSSSTKEIVPVVEINQCPVGIGKPGELTKRMMKLYKEKVLQYISSRKS